MSLKTAIRFLNYVLELLDSSVAFVLRIPSLFFADDDIDRLVTALALAQMPLGSV